MTRFLLLFAGLFTATLCYTQYRPYYTIAFGARAGATGGSSGGTIKGFVSETVAIEGIIGVWHGGIAGTVLLEKYVPAFKTKGLNWYVGGGLHYVARTGYSHWYIIDKRGTNYSNGGSGFGIDAIFGIEYKIPVAPVAFSIDFKPFAEFSSSGGFAVALDPGLGIKLAF
jgi:hypothetical protein